MLSTVPAFSFSEPGLVNQFSGFQTGFTPWECDYSNLFSVSQQLPLEPAVPSPCYGESDTGLVIPYSGFDEIKTGSNKSCASFDGPHGLDDDPDTENTKNCIAIANFDSGEQNHNRNSIPNQPEITDERKRKRKESNRESAKRSRMRKQSHIDNLRNQVNRLNIENRDLQNRLRLVLHQLQRVSTDNNMLVTEQEILRLKLSEMRRILIIRQLQQQQMIMTEQNTYHLRS